MGTLNFSTTGNPDGLRTTQFFDPSDTQLWNNRWVDIAPAGHTITDTRDYTAVANQWLVNHTLPTTNLAKADEDFAVNWTAQVERLDYLGNIAAAAAPSPLSYETYFGSGYDFSASTFAITPGAVTTVGVQNTGFGFDVSFAGGTAGANEFKVGLSIPFDFFGGLFDLFGPVILNLSGSAINITPRQDSNAFYDVDGDGFTERTAWAGPGDGMLVIDLHGNGQPGPDNVIGQTLELAFSKWTADPNDSDLEALATVFDTNHNGQLDPGDARWGEFRVWTDVNQNGLAEAGELQTLGSGSGGSSPGITSISLASDHQTFGLPDGSRIEGLGTFTRDGATFALADAALAYDTVGFKKVPTLTGFNYLSENGTVKAFSDAKVAPWTGEGGGTYYNHPLSVSTDGADGLFGGRYDDTLKSSNAKGVTIYGDLGNDVIWGSAFHNDVLDGGPNQDILFGFGGDDTIYFDHADLVDAGNDINGGAGYDTGIYTTNFPLAMSLATYQLESLISNEGGDLISANPAAAAYIDGRGGNDTLNGGPLGDTLVGGTGNDTLNGAEGADLLSGGANDDTLRGGAGNDVLIGGIGTDTAVFAGPRVAYALTYLGNNTIAASGPDGSDTLVEVERLQFDDATVTAPLTRDLSATLSLSGTTANWSVRNSGTAALSVSFAGVYLSPDPTVTTADINLTTTVIAPLNGGAVDLRTVSLAFPTNLTPGTYYLGALADTGPHYAEIDELNNVSAVIAIMLGNAAANTLLGSTAPDTIFGLDGNDLINGGPGADQLSGGGGADLFQYGPRAVTDAQYGILDHIADYRSAEGDQVDLSYILPSTAVASQPLDSLVRAVHSGTATKLQIDADGTANGANWLTISLLDGVRIGDAVNVIVSGSAPAGVTITVTAAPTESFDGDSHADILWQNANGTTAIWLMNGVNVTSMGAPLNPGAGWHARGAADFNGDGMADILWENDNGTPAVWLMNGTSLVGSGPPLPNPGAGWHTKAAGDFDGDGRADILWQNDNGTPAVWLMNGVNLASASAPLANPGPAWKAKAAADFDGDGMADILWQNDDGHPAVWLMNGVSVKSMGAAQPNSIAQWRVKDAADFNGDGRADILWQNDDGTPSIWLMNGTNLLQVAPAMPNPGAAWHARSAADYDGDGRSDILWQHDNGTAAVWLMNGLSVASYGPALPNPGADWHVI